MKERFYDLNQLLGLFVLLLIVIGLTFAYFLVEDTPEQKSKTLLAVVGGYIFVAVYLARINYCLELTRNLISFKKLLGTKTYRWEDLKQIHFSGSQSRYFFGMVRFNHSYIHFNFGNGSHHYRISKNNVDRISNAVGKIIHDKKLDVKIQY